MPHRRRIRRSGGEAAPSSIKATGVVDEMVVGTVIKTMANGGEHRSVTDAIVGKTDTIGEMARDIRGEFAFSIRSRMLVRNLKSAPAEARFLILSNHCQCQFTYAKLLCNNI